MTEQQGTDFIFRLLDQITLIIYYYTERQRVLPFFIRNTRGPSLLTTRPEVCGSVSEHGPDASRRKYIGS